ncbi:MAG: pantoate--beta-alanine ligase [Armatimonadota bacterium]|nr:pantoate--beta-alanine ligase [Armatimonadota bacterium]
MIVAREKSATRKRVAEGRAGGKTIGLVPTMGALHEGHLSLVRRSVADCDFTVVSIFVNPTQFSPGEDLERYPRDLEGDARKCEEIGVDLIFAPSADEMYHERACTVVTVQGLTEGLCGAHRPGHFDGVTTVVSKLLNIVRPDRAYFGQKDYQQLVVIRAMVRDLDMPVEVVGCPTVREADGLAASSRNQYLSEREREVAPRLYQALQAGAEAAREGATGREVERVVARELGEEPLFRPQYVRAVHPETLEPREEQGVPMVIAAAAHLGETRLIDNVRVEG